MPKPFATAIRSSSLYQTPRWKQESRAHLLVEPYCRRHSQQQRMVTATIVDHIRPHRGDEALFWDQRNWQSLCFSCHQQKTGQEIRARLNPRRPAEAHPGMVAR